MILAAGRGERMGDLTSALPKPLLEVDGRPLIEHTIARLSDSGITNLVVNLAYRGDQIREYLGDGSRHGVSIHYSTEPAGALDTGGGIAAALDLLGPDPFLAVNSDVWTSFDFATLAPPRGLAHLVLVPNPVHNPEGDFCLIDGKMVGAGSPMMTFSGIGVYRPQLFTAHEPGQRFALAPVLRAAIDDDQASGQLFEGCWVDVGTPDRLRHANIIAATQQKR